MFLYSTGAEEERHNEKKMMKIAINRFKELFVIFKLKVKILYVCGGSVATSIKPHRRMPMSILATVLKW